MGRGKREKGKGYNSRERASLTFLSLDVGLFLSIATPSPIHPHLHHPLLLLVTLLLGCAARPSALLSSSPLYCCSFAALCPPPMHVNHQNPIS